MKKDLYSIQKSEWRLYSIHGMDIICSNPQETRAAFYWKYKITYEKIMLYSFFMDSYLFVKKLYRHIVSKWYFSNILIIFTLILLDDVMGQGNHWLRAFTS